MLTHGETTTAAIAAVLAEREEEGVLVLLSFVYIIHCTRRHTILIVEEGEGE